MSQLPEAPHSTNTRFVDRDGYEWQWTIRTASVDEMIEQIAEVKAKVLSKYEPAGYHRRSTASGNGNGNGNAPICPTHGKPMKPSKKYSGWYCPEKVAEDGGDGKPVYCKQSVKA